MKQEFKISQERKKGFLISAAIYFLFFIGFVFLEVHAWQDPTSTSFRKYIFYPWFTFSTLYGMIFNLYNGYFMRIIINEDKIMFESFEITIATDLSKLIIIKDYGNGFKKNEGISVRKSSVRKSILGLFSLRFEHIPIHNFGKNWRRSKLGQQIKQYAPHLFENEKSVKSA
jgi:hypothetical protein